MFRQVLMQRHLAVWLFLGILVGIASSNAYGQQAPAEAEGPVGQFFQIVEPITQDTLSKVRAGTRQLVDHAATTAKGTRPILVFEFLPGDTAPGSSEFGVSYDLASLI